MSDTTIPVLTGEQDQDPADFKTGQLASDPGQTPGCIHDHRVEGRTYRHSHVGWDKPHTHERDAG